MVEQAISTASRDCRVPAENAAATGTSPTYPGAVGAGVPLYALALSSMRLRQPVTNARKFAFTPAKTFMKPAQRTPANNEPQIPQGPEERRRRFWFKCEPAKLGYSTASIKSERPARNSTAPYRRQQGGREHIPRNIREFFVDQQ
jgi:hypothetical protein